MNITKTIKYFFWILLFTTHIAGGPFERATICYFLNQKSTSPQESDFAYLACNWFKLEIRQLAQHRIQTLFSMNQTICPECAYSIIIETILNVDAIRLITIPEIIRTLDLCERNLTPFGMQNLEDFREYLQLLKPLPDKMLINLAREALDLPAV